MGQYLEGTNCKPQTAKDAQQLIGKRINYLTSADIDRSGRGYFFPQYGTVTDQHKKHLEVNGELIPFSSFVELVVLRDATQEELELYLDPETAAKLLGKSKSGL